MLVRFLLFMLLFTLGFSEIELVVETYSCDHSEYFDTKEISDDQVSEPGRVITENEAAIFLLQEIQNSEANLISIKVERTFITTMCGTFDHSGIFKVCKQKKADRVLFHQYFNVSCSVFPHICVFQ